ncbi:integumentary mucin C.1 isoform X2 [Ictalurus punctatus]|uniref:Integumentary mucin C.1 isoform X2 n=1 Tax=Ictalurus punctatus TaxID=7998 RepID=A0A9F7TM09_ICTPU|nr:integumentary mucin C.1 isoform X2 [Ictalurus punctatus]
MLLSILFVGAVLFTNGVTAQTEPTTTNVFILFGNDTADIASSNTATTTTTTQPTALTTTALPVVNDTTHTTTTTTTTESTTLTMINTTTPDTATTSTIYPLPSITTSGNTPSTVSYVNPVRIGLRAVLKSTLQLNITLANQLLQQYIAYLPSYYNVTARVTSITTL